ncbi:MAG TPA: segregation/condensation protein A [Candidatus Polarisedimenticolaceae bacterium]|nr:segregation/condensation protein A [Candidatus Polarisedimenticolaceae bacterium]
MSDDGLRVHVAAFEGPLDLLLHLVRVNEVDITNIPIVEIAAQYDTYLAMMRELDLEVAGEYLVMAATLVHIKSRLLLPPDPTLPEEATEDPRAELTRQLLEYQQLKQATENLQAIDSVRSLIWTKGGSVPAEFEGEELLSVELFDVIAAFKKLLDRLGDDVKLHLRRDDVSVADKIAWLADLLREGTSLDFIETIAALPSRIERIATFLAVLEMVRLQMIVLFQRAAYGDIRIALRQDAAPREET